MDSIGSITSDPTTAAVAAAGSTPTTSNATSASTSSNTVPPAATLEISAVQQQGAMMSALFGSLPNAGSPAALFLGSSELSILNAQGSAAVKYVQQQQPPTTGQTVNASA